MKNAPMKPLALSIVLTTAALPLLAQDTDGTSSTDRANGTGNPDTLLFGDTHLHTAYSFDAYLNNNQTALPDTAYRFAKGLPVVHPYHRARVQLRDPLDFLVVSDHAELLGMMRASHQGTAELEDLGLWGNFKRWIATTLMHRAIDNNEGLAFFGRFLPVPSETRGGDPVADPMNNIDDVSVFGDTSVEARKAWHDIIASAERHNEPGKFTALVGWEWSSVPTGANLHRVILTPDSGDLLKDFLPYGSDQSQYPEDLWAWLDATSKKTGARFLSIPHNSNLSKGYMFAETTLRGKPITSDYARTRIRWEPIVEVTQIKGDSETRSEFSPDDPFADFENYDHYIQNGRQPYYHSAGDYIRPSLKRGLEIEENIGVNPYKFGMIGSTDSHSGLASYEETNFLGKMATDSTPETKERKNPEDSPVTSNGWNMSAAGLAAVWARENTREEIYAAMMRKEVYATTGPRMRVRLFAGWDYADDTIHQPDWVDTGYGGGVPMGGDLTAAPDGKAPEFLIQAVKGPNSANLDRVQVIKGWLDTDGTTVEKIYDVAWSDDRQISADGTLPPVGNTVDLTVPSYTNTIGAEELITQWSDPDFDPAVRAFYYVRVLEIPTPRHTVYDAVALGLDAPPRGASIIQERAYTSPVWYTPKSE